MPKRIQRTRTKGWRMPEGAVYVGRPTGWGNPWRVGDTVAVESPSPLGRPSDVYHREFTITPALAVEFYRIAFEPDAEDARELLAGRDLCCWCPLDAPCHADVLLKLANGVQR